MRGARVGAGVRKQGGDWDGLWAWSGQEGPCLEVLFICVLLRV